MQCAFPLFEGKHILRVGVLAVYLKLGSMTVSYAQSFSYAVTREKLAVTLRSHSQLE